jgi:hypothetical protein
MNWEEDMRAELSKLRAEVERLRSEMSELSALHAHSVGFWEPKLVEMRAHLAAATELVREMREHIPHDRRPGSVFRRSGAFLAAQPAAPTRGCVHFDFMRGMVCDECKTSA